jgi:hypothetical protein
MKRSKEEKGAKNKNDEEALSNKCFFIDFFSQFTTTQETEF